MKKNKMSAEEKAYIARKESFQQHLPIMDIDKNLLVDKEGNYYPVIEIGEKSIGLMDVESLLALLRNCNSVFEALDLKRSQFLSVPIPFDIEPYIKNQRRIYAQTQQRKKEVANSISFAQARNEDTSSLEREVEQLEKYLTYIDNQTKFVESHLANALIVNKKCFLIPKIRDSKNRIAVEEATKNIVAKIQHIADTSHRCGQQEIQDILFNILNPGNHTTYHAEDKQYSPQIEASSLAKFIK